MVDKITGGLGAGTRRVVTIGAACGTAAWLFGGGANVGSARLPTWFNSLAIAQTVPPRSRPDGFADVVDRVKPAVIAVHTKIEPRSAGEGLALPRSAPPDRFSQQFGESRDPNDEAHTPHPRTITTEGSGFFISSDGYAVTTNHVVEGGKSVEITTDDHKTYAAKVVGTDAKTDLALLKVDAGREVPFVRLANNAPRIGEWVLAVGNPFGLGGTVTAGIVSARGRDIETDAHRDLIQIDAPVNQGNSGGPTFNLDGNVIGVNSAIFSPSGASVGIGFAIPAETVNAVIPQLRAKRQ